MISQAQMESLYSKRQVNTVLFESIRHELDGFLLNWSLRTWYAIERYMEGNYYDSKNERLEKLQELVDEKGMEYLLIRIVAGVISSYQPQTLQQVVGFLQAFLPHEDPFQRAVTAAELIGLGESNRGLYTLVCHKAEMTTVEVNHWDLVDEHLLDSFDWINGTGFNPPLVEKPIEVTDNSNCGYHSIKEPLILGDLTYHDEQQCLGAINALNEIEWLLDQDVLAEQELPSKPLKDQQARENFLQMVQESEQIYKMLGDKPFWFAWQYDTRGRIYSHGYHVNVQSAEYKKAALNFNHFEELT